MSHIFYAVIISLSGTTEYAIDRTFYTFFFLSFSVALVFTVSDRKYYQKQLALIEAYEDLERLQHEDARDQTKLDDEAMTTLRLSQLSFFANFVRIFLTPDLFPTVFKLSIFILHDYWTLLVSSRYR